MHTSYRSAHQLLSNTVNSGTDPAEFISHSASPMFELDRQSEFQYSTRSSIWPISTHWHHFVINTILRFDFISTIYDHACPYRKILILKNQMSSHICSGA